MKKGLVLGKFMPLHSGHLALIEFGLSKCDHLTILLCHYAAEPVPGLQRLGWLNKCFTNDHRIRITAFEYNPLLLPDSSEPKPEYARLWAEKIRELVSDIDVFFSSEKYGINVAAYLKIEHGLFDEERHLFPVSASAIRQKPFTYWNFMPKTVQPYFIKKVALLGSESTGKSTLAKRLATHYQTLFVPEMARAVVDHSDSCTFEQLTQIAILQAQTIIAKTGNANKLFFCDTDVTITKSYAKFLFHKELVVPEWIEKVNSCDLYLFLETDCPYVQDGTRLEETERNRLNEAHKKELKNLDIGYKTIYSNWEQRFDGACKEIDNFIGSL